MIPIDISQATEAKNIIELAKNNSNKDTQFILMNVVEEVPTWVAAQIPDYVHEKSRKYALEQLKSIAKGIDNKLKIEVRTGRPYSSILEVAENEGVDLIIIASHKPGIEDYFLGSTAAKVVRHARCSVLVVR